MKKDDNKDDKGKGKKGKKKIKTDLRNNKPPKPEDKQSELGSIFQSTDALTPKEKRERDKKKEEEKFELQGGGTNSIKDVKDFRAANKQPYKTHFGYEKPFYYIMYKLNECNSWPIDEYKKFSKRPEVAVWTVRLIYARFGKEAIKHMRDSNPVLFAYIRRDKYFQYLTKDGQDKLDEYIEQFMRMSIGYSDWDKFEADYCAKYKLDRPTKLF
jgi:hypothetical protein